MGVPPPPTSSSTPVPPPPPTSKRGRVFSFLSLSLSLLSFPSVRQIPPSTTGEIEGWASSSLACSVRDRGMVLHRGIQIHRAGEGKGPRENPNGDGSNRDFGVGEYVERNPRLRTDADEECTEDRGGGWDPQCPPRSCERRGALEDRGRRRATRDLETRACSCHASKIQVSRIDPPSTPHQLTIACRGSIPMCGCPAPHHGGRPYFLDRTRSVFQRFPHKLVCLSLAFAVPRRG